MPSRALYQQTKDGFLSRKNRDSGVTEFPFPETMASASKFTDNNPNIASDQWDEWMTWDGPSAEDLASIDHVYSPTSISSKDVRWPTIMKHNLNTFDQMVVDDASYELDDSLAVPDLDQELEFPSPNTLLGPDQRRPYYGYSSLTISEERELQQIAMPRKKSTESTTTASPAGSSFSSEPEPVARPRSTKRKSSSKSTDTDSVDLCQSRKRGHNAIEKRYRTNLNEKIVLLRQSVPSLRMLPEGEVADEDDAEKADEKFGKAVVLMRAVEYISHLEECTERLGREALALQARVAAFEKLAMAGAIQMSGGVMASTKVSRVETLDSIKADFQQSSHDRAERIKSEPKPRKRSEVSRTSRAKSSSKAQKS